MAETDFLHQLNAIRERQGKEPIDGTRMEGFGDGQPPPPVFFDRLSDAEPRPDFPDDEEIYDTPEVPPLVKIAMDRPRLNPALDAELVVTENAATYRQRPVLLTEPEKAAIVTVVLKALRRSLDEQYQEIAGRPMRRSREKKEPAKAKRKRAPVEHSQT
jgi:hypothetical protein